MRLLFIINTPAQAYTWKYVIYKLLKKGHAIKILARDYGSTPILLDHFNLQYSVFKSIGSRSWRLLGALGHFQSCYTLSHEFTPTMVVGFGLDAAVTASRFGRPCIVFVDDEGTHFQNKLTHLLSSVMITPNTFKENLGKKHIPINGYKELAYLHPKYFQPDISIFDQLKIRRGEKFVILRFNAFDAVHDIGKHGFSTDDQLKMVKEIEKYAHVFISPEGKLPEELQRARLPIAMDRIHHAIYYSHLLITDTQTMATESAILGTPVVRSNGFVGTNDMGNFIELEQKYDLIYSFKEPEKALKKAIDLVKQQDLKEQWDIKRQRLLKEKIDVAQFIGDFIENYPVSFQEYKNMRGSR